MPRGAASVYRPLWDRIAITATAACALHCLLLAFVLPVLMLIGLTAFADPRFEQAVLLTSLMLAFVVLVHGYRHHHRRWQPLLIGALGAAIYAARSSAGEALEPMILALGASCIVSAHMLNLRYARLPSTGSAAR